MNRKNEPNEEALKQIKQGAILLPYSIDRLNNLICGCGSPQLIWAWVLEYLQRLAAADRDFPVFMEPKTPGDWMLLYAVDYAGMTEHGVGIRGGWITDEGREALEFLAKRGADWERNGFYVNADGVCCGDSSK